MAGMICVRPGRETRLLYRTQTYRGRTGEKKGFRAREFEDLLSCARRQLDGAPLIVVWDLIRCLRRQPVRVPVGPDHDEGGVAEERPPVGPDPTLRSR
ncbi:hypothetical protein QCN29_20870 [Streptomyces sp. HNM0663]|uniref:Transposase n=1 Tax=Streptomyces chengmaiensis TaxID=3040919 RepID=A0ABT6HR53_9ACTN|nr:hypothetical protein [Streptomyces chengmaiensis]MDH2391197.1 hypothetical protein [Streptomyces chengmaiensis]